MTTTIRHLDNHARHRDDHRATTPTNNARNVHFSSSM